MSVFFSVSQKLLDSLFSFGIKLQNLILWNNQCFKTVDKVKW